MKVNIELDTKECTEAQLKGLAFMFGASLKEQEEPEAEDSTPEPVEEKPALNFRSMSKAYRDGLVIDFIREKVSVTIQDVCRHTSLSYGFVNLMLNRLVSTKDLGKSQGRPKLYYAIDTKPDSRTSELMQTGKVSIMG